MQPTNFQRPVALIAMAEHLLRQASHGVDLDDLIEKRPSTSFVFPVGSAPPLSPPPQSVIPRMRPRSEWKPRRRPPLTLEEERTKAMALEYGRLHPEASKLSSEYKAAHRSPNAFDTHLPLSPRQNWTEVDVWPRSPRGRRPAPPVLRRKASVNDLASSSATAPGALRRTTTSRLPHVQSEPVLATRPVLDTTDGGGAQGGERLGSPRKTPLPPVDAADDSRGMNARAVRKDKQQARAAYGDAWRPMHEIKPLHEEVLESVKAEHSGRGHWHKFTKYELDGSRRFDTVYGTRTPKDRSVLQSVRKEPESAAKRLAFSLAVQDMTRMRYFTNEPVERTVRVARVARPRPKPRKAWKLEESIWAPRPRWCDSREFLDTPACARAMLATDWARACDAALRKFINRVDDGDDDAEEGDGVDDEALTRATHRAQLRVLVHP